LERMVKDYLSERSVYGAEEWNHCLVAALVVPRDRHQPFQGINIPNIINCLSVKDDAKTDILLQRNSNGYRARCHWWQFREAPYEVARAAACNTAVSG
jgi:hypothetical protein